MRAHHGERISAGEGIILRQAADDLALCGQAGAQRLGNVILRKAAVDQAGRPVKISPCLATGNVVRQTDVQILQGIVDIHKKVLKKFSL